MTPASKMRLNVFSAVLAGFGLRIFFVFRFPVSDAGDSPFYIELAWNWLKRHVYGLVVNGHLVPVDMRVPGYPAFLAGIFAVAGRSERAVMIAQSVLDMLACLAIALIASRLAPPAARRRVAIAALWLAALCPFTANYTAAVLAETLATFLTAIAILVLLGTELGAGGNSRNSVRQTSSFSPWFLAGIIVGLATLVRPETPLLLFAAGLVLVWQWRRAVHWTQLIRAAALMALGLLLPLAPWAARNLSTLHKVQFLAPRYGELPGELAPRGFDAWEHTWLWRFRDVFLVDWKLDSEKIQLADIPRSAFDSRQQRAQVAELLAAYNKNLTLTPAEDRAFGEIARQRTARHPLRTWIKVPLLRSLALWFAPRVELLPYTGQLFPISSEWENDREDFCVTLALVLINVIYLALAAMGALFAWRVSPFRPAVAFLLAFIVVRTAFFAWFVQTPEPRYVLECFPAVIALAALAFSCGLSSRQPVRDESSAGKFAESVPSPGLPARP
ncbi:MAG: glycosyltransferase family 39 protein [Candidatus Acidiferrales bacterium]